MNSTERYAMIAARLFIATMFILNGLNIIGQALAAHELAVYGAPAGLITSLIFSAHTLQLIAGSCLILGVNPRVSALALLLFLIPATIMAHSFWQSSGTPLYQVQLINFSKNLAMAGGLIFVIATRSQPVLLPRPTR